MKAYIFGESSREEGMTYEGVEMVKHSTLKGVGHRDRMGENEMTKRKHKSSELPLLWLLQLLLMILCDVFRLDEHNEPNHSCLFMPNSSTWLCILSNGGYSSLRILTVHSSKYLGWLNT